MQVIILTEAQKQTLTNHSEKEEPNESCAILFGNKKGEEITVKELFLTENIEKSPVNFTISAEQRLQADKMERESEMELVGIFHSHPDSHAYPSNTDKKFMELNPEVWVIFSGVSKDFKAYVLDSEIKEIPIQIVKSGF